MTNCKIKKSAIIHKSANRFTCINISTHANLFTCVKHISSVKPLITLSISTKTSSINKMRTSLALKPA